MSTIGTAYTGIRYREHKTRKHKGKPDRYWLYKRRLDGKVIEEGIGYQSEGWTLGRVRNLVAQLKEAQRTGSGPRTLREMREQAAQETKAKKEQAVLAARAEALTVRVMCMDHYMPWAVANKSSHETDRLRLAKHVLPLLGDTPAAQVTVAMVEELRDNLLNAGLSVSSVRQVLAVLRRAYNIAGTIVIDGHPLYSEKNPAAGITLKKSDNARKRFLTYDQADALIELARKRHPDIHDFIVLGLNTGMRRQEMVRLRWEHVDIAHAIIHLPNDPKLKTGGTVYLNADAMMVIQRRKGIDPVMVYPHKREKTLTSWISHTFRDLINELGFNDGITDRAHRLVFHSLRHTFASWLVLAGTDIYLIKELCRHKTIEMTMRYAHLIPDRGRYAVDHLRPTDPE
ncbi:tyrosine-type recombinase/integrase [Desulfovibrio inopinatus]|uniref:tyrosine-type recombinase/integrase n=1 Tax=Desulfovibrio inopinatus TaxID=102109 RepID=UPI0003FADDEA|nr:site-specific integrase [Desulfovibrio inopinatus]